MADQSISIRLALTDGGKVKAELVDIGASGQKALERIRDAAQPASRGLQALDVAGHAVRGKIQEMAGSAGVLGEALQKIGPYGLAAAAGVGAVTVALGFAMNKAREVTEHFDTLADQAARIGTSVESFQELVYAFGQIGVKADATETALTRLNDVIGDVMIQGAKTPAEVARAFDQLGIAMADVQKHGSDLDWMLAAMAEGMKSLGTQAERTAVAKALMGKQAAALLPLLAEGAARLREQTQAASDAGAVLGKDLVQRYDEFGDRLDAVGQIMQTQAGRLFPEIAEGTVLFAEAVATLTTNVADLLDDLRQELGSNIFKEIVEWAFSALKPIQEVLGLVNGIWNFVKSHQASGSTGEAMVDDLLGGQAPGYITGGGFGGAPAAAVRLPTPVARPASVPHGSGRGGWPQLKEEAGGGKKSEAEKEAEQVAELIAKAHLAADAEERLAKAAGMSSAALRQAANDNKVAAFAQEHGATAAARYRVEIERASDAEQRRQINATVLGLTQQADAAERVAAAQGHGAAAAHLATLQNQAFAEALKAGAAGRKSSRPPTTPCSNNCSARTPPTPWPASTRSGRPGRTRWRSTEATFADGSERRQARRARRLVAGGAAAAPAVPRPDAGADRPADAAVGRRRQGQGADQGARGGGARLRADRPAGDQRGRRRPQRGGAGPRPGARRCSAWRSRSARSPSSSWSRNR